MTVNVLDVIEAVLDLDRTRARYAEAIRKAIPGAASRNFIDLREFSWGVGERSIRYWRADGEGTLPLEEDPYSIPGSGVSLVLLPDRYEEPGGTYVFSDFGRSDDGAREREAVDAEKDRQYRVDYEARMKREEEEKAREWLREVAETDRAFETFLGDYFPALREEILAGTGEPREILLTRVGPEAVLETQWRLPERGEEP